MIVIQKECGQAGWSMHVSSTTNKYPQEKRKAAKRDEERCKRARERVSEDVNGIEIEKMTAGDEEG